MHLDCSFLPVGDGHALIYPDGMRDIPAALRETYDLIEVTRDEQQRLGTNVLSLAPDCVISRQDSTRINAEMRSRGIEVVELPYSEPPKTGGSFRCCTLPLASGALTWPGPTPSDGTPAMPTSTTTSSRGGPMRSTASSSTPLLPASAARSTWRAAVERKRSGWRSAV